MAAEVEVVAMVNTRLTQAGVTAPMPELADITAVQDAVHRVLATGGTTITVAGTEIGPSKTVSITSPTLNVCKWSSGGTTGKKNGLSDHQKPWSGLLLALIRAQAELNDRNGFPRSQK